MPNQIIVKKIKYLYSHLSYYYEKINCINRRRGINPYLPTIQVSKPLYEELSSEDLSDKEKISCILNYLNTKTQSEATQETQNNFWWEIMDWKEENSTHIQTKNGNRLIYGIYQASLKHGFWSGEISSIYLELYRRQELTPTNEDEVTPEIQKKTSEIWNNVINLIDSKKNMLPERVMYFRTNWEGVLVETKDPTWHYVDSYTSLDSKYSQKRLSEKSLEIYGGYKKYWAERFEGEYKYGLELEVLVPVANKQKMFEELDSRGLWYKNLITQSEDHSQNRTVDDKHMLRCEFGVQPLNYETAMDVWKKLGEGLKAVGGISKNEYRSGTHLHIDTIESQTNLISFCKNIAELQNKADFFGRGEETPNGFQSGSEYVSYLGNEIIEKPSGIKEIKGCINIVDGYIISDKQLLNLRNKNKLPDVSSLYEKGETISETSPALNSKYSLINLTHSNSIEIRAFNGSLEPHKYLEKLAKEVLEKTKGFTPEIIYGASYLNAQNQLENNNEEQIIAIPDNSQERGQ